jgi:hypothetical protein
MRRGCFGSLEGPPTRELLSAHILICLPELRVWYIGTAGISGISGTSGRTDVETRDERGSFGVLSGGALLLAARLSPRKFDVEKRDFFSLFFCASSVEGGVDFRLCRKREDNDGIVDVAVGVRAWDGSTEC